MSSTALFLGQKEYSTYIHSVLTLKRTLKNISKKIFACCQVAEAFVASRESREDWADHIEKLPLQDTC